MGVTVPILWRHLWARIKPRLSYYDLEAIFRVYAAATARNEPVLTYVNQLRESHSTSDAIDDLVETISERLRAISAEETKANQSRACRVLLLEQADIAIPDHYLTLGGDESLRHVCLAAMYCLETDEDIRKTEAELLRRYFNALWIEASIACLYEEQFNSYMSVDAFSKPYRAMTTLYTRFLCTKLFSQVMSQNDRADLRSISELYEEACADGTVVELSEIRSNFFDAIRKGFVDNLYPLQERFAKIAQSAQSAIESSLASGAIARNV